KGHSPIVVSHRGVGRKLTGAFHEETVFGPVPGKQNVYTGKKSVAGLTPDHLRLPRAESHEEAIDRLAQRYLQRRVESDVRKARKRAKTVVESRAFRPRLVDPPPEKSGIVRDVEVRRVLRDLINKKLI